MYWNNLPTIFFSILEESKMKNYKYLIITIFLALFVTITTNSILLYYEGQKTSARIAQVFDEVDRKMAVEKLSELRGRLIEVKELLHTDVPRYIIEDQINDIVDFPLYDNPYLNEFEFTIDYSTSSTEEICDDLIAQIYDQIDVIWFSN